MHCAPFGCILIWILSITGRGVCWVKFCSSCPPLDTWSGGLLQELQKVLSESPVSTSHRSRYGQRNYSLAASLCSNGRPNYVQSLHLHICVWHHCMLRAKKISLATLGTLVISSMAMLNSLVRHQILWRYIKYCRGALTFWYYLLQEIKVTNSGRFL